MVNVWYTFPSPFRMLDSVEDKYINGHSQERMVMYVPAKGSWKTRFPRKSPNKRKNAVQKNPKIPLKVRESRITLVR